MVLMAMLSSQSCTDELNKESGSADKSADNGCSTSELKGLYVDESGNLTFDGVRKDNSLLELVSDGTNFLLHEKTGELLLNFGDYRKGETRNLCNKVFYQIEFLAYNPVNINSVQWVNSDNFRIPVLEDLLRHKRKTIDILQDGNNYFVELLSIEDTVKRYPEVAVFSKNGRYVTGTVYQDMFGSKQYAHSFHFGELTDDFIDFTSMVYSSDTTKINRAGSYKFEQFDNILVSLSSGVFYIKCDSSYLRRYRGGIQAFRECNQNMFINGFDHAFPRMNLFGKSISPENYLFSGVYNIPLSQVNEPEGDFSPDLAGRTENRAGRSSGTESTDIDCGAYIEPGYWKRFMCYNLGAANTRADPLTPGWQINGGYWQWGQKKIAATNPAKSGESKSDVYGWNTSEAANGSLSDRYKTVNDPCPAGYRIPKKSEWDGVLENNKIRRVGSWNNSANAFDSGVYLGDNLFLPAAGVRDKRNGLLRALNTSGFYWSSTAFSTSNSWLMGFNDKNTYTGHDNRTYGNSVRCIAE
jgi:uncharacterized protein (TIGR02145 family)